MTATIASGSTVVYLRPGFEGANIRTWIGFKHFMYLAEQAVLEWLREQGAGARTLYLEHGLGVEIVDSSVQIPAALEVDEQVCARVTGDGKPCRVRLSVTRAGREVTVLRGTVTVALVRERGGPAYRPAPPALSGLEVTSLAGRAAEPTDPAPLAVPTGTTAAQVLAGGPSAFVRGFRAPYYYCHFSDRVQHSGFVRALEDVVDRYLADRGVSVARLLRERSWIPVVSRARVRLLAEAHMEETIHTRLSIVDVLGGVMFEARHDCYAERRGELVPVATARILHGYAVAAGDGTGSPVRLDGDVLRALTGSPR